MCADVTRGRVFFFLSGTYLTHANWTTTADVRYKSLKLSKIDFIDLTQQFSLSIFTEFRYQSIKITRLLPIFIDTNFYRLTTAGLKHAPRDCKTVIKKLSDKRRLKL